MRTLNSVLTEITQLTSNIETNFPELYQYLDENPITLIGDNSEIGFKEFENYLETLKEQLKDYIESHPHHKTKRAA